MKHWRIALSLAAILIGVGFFVEVTRFAARTGAPHHPEYLASPPMGDSLPGMPGMHPSTPDHPTAARPTNRRPAVLWGTTVYYIRPAPYGDDDNDGKSFDGAWATFSKLAQMIRIDDDWAEGYDSCLVEPGIYNETVFFERGGEAHHPFVVMKRGTRGQVVVRGVASPVDGDSARDFRVLCITGARHLTLDGITIYPAKWSVRVAKVRLAHDVYATAIRGARNILFKNCQWWTNAATWNDGGETWFGFFDEVAGKRAGRPEGYRPPIRGIVVTASSDITFYECSVRGFEFGSVHDWPHTYRVNWIRDTLDHTYTNQMVIGAKYLGDSTQGGDRSPVSQEDWHGYYIDSCVFGVSWSEDNIQFEQAYDDAFNTKKNRGVIIRNSQFFDAVENAIDFKGAGWVWIDRCIFGKVTGANGGKFESTCGVAGGSACDTSEGYCDLNEKGFRRSTWNHNGGYSLEPGRGSGTNRITIRRSVVYDGHGGADWWPGAKIAHNIFANNRRHWRGPNRNEETVAHVNGPMYWGDNPALLYGRGTERSYNNIFLAMPGHLASTSAHRDNVGALMLLLTPSGDTDYNLFYDSIATAQQIRFAYHDYDNSETTHFGNRWAYVSGLESWQKIHAIESTYTNRDLHSQFADPRFIRFPIYPWGDWNVRWNYGVRASSPCRDAGRWLAQAENTSGPDPRRLKTDDPYWWYFPILGNPRVTNDTVFVEGFGPAEIDSIDYDGGVILLSRPAKWSTGTGLSLWPMYEKRPDIGAVEYRPPVAD